jgi:hypothetical protein
VLEVAVPDSEVPDSEDTDGADIDLRVWGLRNRDESFLPVLDGAEDIAGDGLLLRPLRELEE